MTRAFTRLPYKDQIETPVSAQSPADTVPVSNPQDAGTTLLGSAPLGAGHTPGPWEISRANTDTNRFGIVAGDFIIADMQDDVPKDTHPVRANARLISLAPELAESVRDLLAEVDEMEKRVGWAGYGARSRARALLSKLKGSV